VYYSRFPRDHWKIKALVALILALEWAHSICIAHTFYIITILKYGHIEELATMPISLKISTILSSAVSLMVELFFANRIRLFAGNAYIAVFCCVLIVWRAGVGIFAVVGAMESSNIIVFTEKYRFSIMACGLGATIDLTIACSLCYFLARYRKTSIERTVQHIDGLIAWTIETGMVTGLTSVSVLICFVTMPNNLIWLAIYSYMDRLYSNSWLAILNSRAPQNRTRQAAFDLSNSEWALSSIAPNGQYPQFTSSGTIAAQQSDAPESRSSCLGHDVIHKDESLVEDKRSEK